MTQEEQVIKRRAIDDAVREFEESSEHAINREVAEMGQRVITAAVHEMAKRLRSTAGHEYQIDKLKHENQQLRELMSRNLYAYSARNDEILTHAHRLINRWCGGVDPENTEILLDVVFKQINQALFNK